MARVPLNGRAYQERSIIASAQETINLYGESNQDDALAPTPFTYYQTPGLSLVATPNPAGKARCSYRTSIGTAYIVIAGTIYFLAVNGALVIVGNIPNKASQVYMSDNGLAVVVVDGTNGWAIDINTNAFGPIIDPSFLGADFVVLLDTFFVFNRPATNQFYISLSNVSYALLTTGTSFDPLDIAAKSGFSDPIVAILAIHKELWLVGALTTEVWQGTGAADFYFQIVQGAYIQHGCIAKYTATNTDIVGFWLMQDLQGKNIVIQAANYDVSEISTPFLVDELNSYATTDDALAFCFQQDDHAFLFLIFPTANKSWLYELKTKQWNRIAWLNINDGSLNRHRANCGMYFNKKNIVCDWETGLVYEFTSAVSNDNGVPIVRMKTFAHMVDNLDRVSYKYFDADITVGTELNQAIDPQIFLSWSDDRGRSFGNPVAQSMGKSGQYLTTVSWNRLGMARDRIFKVQHSEDIPKWALNGGFAEPVKGRT